MWWIAAAVLVILGAAVAWYLGSPLFISKTVDEPFPTAQAPAKEAFPLSAGATVPEGMTQEQVEEAMKKASEVNASMAEPVPATGAVTALERGTFVGADDFHRGEGTATVYRVGQDLVLRLDAFKVTNGPDLHVILTKQAAPKTRADVQAGYVEVAKLKGNLGSQNYTLPAEVRPGEYRAVIIYCKPFHVVFATAALQAAR
jgi:hypothetical protein